MFCCLKYAFITTSRSPAFYSTTSFEFNCKVIIEKDASLIKEMAAAIHSVPVKA